ncbi:hypothetical protein BGX33_002846 [Mortierella sp. NVP41]|nr:hypothetical protein BGX33_002846 [Mortierella sp. NVP41]
MLDILIASNPGQVVQVDYDDDEAITCITERVRDHLGREESLIIQETLYINGIRINDTIKTLNHYRIFVDTITYDTKHRGESEFVVRMLGGESYSFNYEPSWTCSKLEEELQNMTGMSVYKMHLIFNGRWIGGYKTTLKD